jgi:hypothetical protein
MSLPAIWRWVAVTAFVAMGIIGTAVALGSRNADSELLLRERHPLEVTTSSVERLVRMTAPSPLQGHHANATRASCKPGSATGLKNPWRCAIDYPGAHALYGLNFRPNGSYVGRDLRGTGLIRGCCIAVPGR